MKILVVEDDPIARTKLEVLLSAYGSCDVAETGQAAIRFFQKAHSAGAPYRLVTMDIGLPDLSGQEVVKRIRDWELEHSINKTGIYATIIMVTAMDDMKNIQASFWEGCEGYLIKPVTPETLQGQLDKLHIYPLQDA